MCKLHDGLARTVDQYNELGRPSLWRLRRCYFPMWVLSKITAPPIADLTSWSLFSCGFVFDAAVQGTVLESSRVHCGGSVAAAPLMMYWLTFPCFLRQSVGLRCAIRTDAYARRIDFQEAPFCLRCYSLMMTAFPQSVVFQPTCCGVSPWRSPAESRGPGAASYIWGSGVFWRAGICFRALILDLPARPRALRIAVDASSWRRYRHRSVATLMRPLRRHVPRSSQTGLTIIPLSYEG